METTEMIVIGVWLLLCLGFVCPLGIATDRDYQARKMDQMKGDGDDY